jgi:5'-3' exoribonuclease 1
MEILFINLLKEYMALEWDIVNEKNRFKKYSYNVERIIDDFVMLSFFIGNDFLH